MKRTIQAFLSTYIHRVIGRYYLLIAAASFLVTGLAVWVVASQWNINSDFKALLPRSSQAYLAMEEVGERIGSGSALFVVIDSPDMEANKEFAADLASQLRQMPEVTLAHYHNDKTFFEEHQLLYMEVDDLETLKERIAEKIKAEKRKANPLFVSLGGSKEDDPGLKTEDLQDKYDDLAHQSYKEYLVADDGYSLTIIVRFIQSSTNLEATNALLDRVRQTAQKLEPTSYHPEMIVDYGGGLINRQKEYSSILDDVRSSALFTVLGLFLVIALYFRRVRAVAFVLTPLIMGVLWTLAIGFLIFGELTTITAFIFAILLGLGIDFSIHLLSGYDHARMEGLDTIDALERTYQTIGRATVIGAVTTFVTFVVLSFAQFRGLSQFGQVASIGVLCILGAMLTVLPALVLTFHRIWPHEPAARSPSRFLTLSPERLFAGEAMGRRAPIFLAIAAALTLVSVLQLPELRFEENFRRVGEVEWPWDDEEVEPKATPADEARRLGERKAKAVVEQAADARRRIAPESFKPLRKQRTLGQKYTSAVKGQETSTPTLLLFDDSQDAAKVYRYMDEKMKAGELETIKTIGSIHAFIPAEQQVQNARAEKLEEIDAVLQEDDIKLLEGDERDKAEELKERLDATPFDVYDLPEWTKRLFKEAGPGARAPAEGEEFAFEYTIYVNEAIDQMHGDEARAFLNQLEDIKTKTGVDFRIGSQSYVYVAMLDEIKTDGAIMMGIALVVVLLILIFSFGDVRRGMIAMTPLIFGAVWMLGIGVWLGVRLDFFNVVIIPVIIGLGVDDGVHFYYYYLKLGRGSVQEVTQKIGTAIVMTSITSAIGFGGLAITDYDGLRSIGILAIIGIATTLLATLLILPALLTLGERRGWAWMYRSE